MNFLFSTCGTPTRLSVPIADVPSSAKLFVTFPAKIHGSCSSVPPLSHAPFYCSTSHTFYNSMCACLSPQLDYRLLKSRSLSHLLVIFVFPASCMGLGNILASIVWVCARLCSVCFMSINSFKPVI